MTKLTSEEAPFMYNKPNVLSGYSTTDNKKPKSYSNGFSDMDESILNPSKNTGKSSRNFFDAQTAHINMPSLYDEYHGNSRSNMTVV